MARPRVLFLAEGVSLAHVARPSVLAETLDPARFDVHFASNGEYRLCHEGLPFTFHRIESITPALFLRRLSTGSPVYRYDELRRYVESDLALMERVRPDLIVQDFRLSMAISARKFRIPLVSICNSHWSPLARPAFTTAPELPISRFVPPAIMDAAFRLSWPIASKSHLRAANRLRRDHGLPPYPSLGAYYCDGDQTLYADPPSLAGLEGMPDSHRFIGPIVWSPAMPLPTWWPDVRRGVPLAYVTLGSTGDVSLLPRIVDVCRECAVDVVASTAARSDYRSSPPEVHAAPYLPGTEAAARASFVICNGGSATVYQALSEGRPVLGIASNLDQVLTMQRVAAAGAGLFLRASEATGRRLRMAIDALVRNPAFADHAIRLQRECAPADTAGAFSAAVDRLLGRAECRIS